MQEDCQTKKCHLKYCCPAKQYYSNDACNLENNLKILPRAIIYKKSLKVHNTYQFTVNVINQGLYKRPLAFSTDSSDASVRVVPPELANNFLKPDQSLQVFVCIEPQTKSKINRRRHVFITSQHPNIIFSIPIIILAKVADSDDISLPLCLRFPPATVENFTYYEMIVYNKSSKKLQFNIRCPHPNLTVHAKSFNIKRKDYGEVLLKLYCKDCYPVDNCLKLKFNTGENFDIAFKHEPLQWSLFVDTLNINFDCVRFQRKKSLEFSICNESNKDIMFDVNFNSQEETLIDNYEENLPGTTRNSAIFSSDLNNCKRTQNVDKFSYKHFLFEPNCGTVRVNSTYFVKITFCPIMHNEFLLNSNDISSLSVISSISISWKNDMKIEKRMIYLCGEIIGPEIEISPAVLDLPHLYFGEEYCTQITVLNKDDICDAHVDFYGLSNWHNARILVTPKKGLTLKPGQKSMFQIKFYCTAIGRFLEKLEFKVKNGGKYSMIIRGYCKHVRVKCFPETLSLGVIPIAIPQNRFVLLINPLTVPVTVQCTVMGDGTETPLVLNTHNAEEHLPITVKNPFNYLKQSYNQKCDLEDFQVEENFEFRYDFEESESALLSINSHIENNSNCSSEFERSALDLIPNMSYNFVSYLKAIKIYDKPEMEKKVIEEALNVILTTPYFFNMDKYKNYTQMDWNSLATDPQEIYCNTEIIYLKPNTGKAISIVVIPNVLGHHSKYIELRVCPIMQSTSTAVCKETTDLCQIVKTDIMTSKLSIHYNCSVPEVIWDNVIIMEDQLYAGEYYDFQMVFQNNSNFGGFFYYDVIPQSSLGIMKFPNNKWKYFIEPDSKRHVPCQVKFTKLGFIILSGIIKFVGVYATYPFHIKAHVLPPKIKIFPRSICKNMSVLEYETIYIFIENATPTSTWFKLKLKDESCMSIEPLGAQLGPSENAMYATLRVWSQNPGIYKNVLYIIMEFETIEKIPITISVKGIPIFFEPEVRAKDLNVGYILCNTERDNNEDYPNYSYVIKVINKGLRYYRLSITRTKCSAKPICSISSSKAKFIIKPNNLLVPALSENKFIISISCSESTSVYSAFLIQLTDHNDVQHIESYRFSLSATFIMPQLSWNRRDITLNYYRTYKFKEHKQWECIQLTNITQYNVDYVNLKISRPFKIKELFEHKYEDELNFSMAGLQTKEFLITLNNEVIRNRLNKVYDGSIICSANSILQRPVRLKLLVLVPKITLKPNQITLFTKEEEGRTFIKLTNTGEVPAIYKWKKLKEEWNYISPEDDTNQVASIILSDLMRMLELQTIDAELDSETNISRRYHKYKCFLKDLNYTINTKEILYEVIDNLDLCQKRYELSYQTPLPPDIYSKEETKLNMYSTDYIQSQMYEPFDMEISQHLEQTELKRNNIADHLKSQTTYINRKLVPNSSDGIFAADKTSKIESGVYYILDDVLGHLKLEDSYEDRSLPSSESCEPGSSIYFFEKCGLLQKKESNLCALHLPPTRKGFEVRAKFQLNVTGGNSQHLEITLVNLDKTVTLNKQIVYLGVKPWYERYCTKSYIDNVTNYQLSLKLNQVPKNFKHKLPKIALGFNNILGSKTLLLPPFENTIVRTEGAMGFAADFERKISIIINENEEKILEFYGHGVMPMAIISKPTLALVDQHPDEIIEEYRLLQKLYYYNIFQTITERDEEFFEILQEEENILQEDQNYSTDLALSSIETANRYETSQSSLEIKREQHFINLVRTYVFVNDDNKNLPNNTVLDQLLQTEKFLNYLLYNSATRALLNSLYQNYLLHFKSHDEKMPPNLKYFNVQSIPFHLKANILDMGKIYLNQYCKFLITLEFIGPGKLIAAARTAIKIPGLTIDFRNLENDEGNNFNYYRPNDKFTLCDKLYRNINERILETNVKAKHAHSYDFNPLQQHESTVTIENNKCQMNFYNGLNKSIYLEQKHHFTYCKIYANSKCTFSRTKINVIILFRPQKPFFRHNQNVEDYLYIDLHMAATLPILLRALIIDRNRKDNS